MVKAEAKMLFAFLSALYPNAKEFGSDTTLLAWLYVLSPYEYKAVREHVAEWSRSHEFPPRASEIAIGLRPLASEETTKTQEAATAPSAEKQYDGTFDRNGRTCVSPSYYARKHGITWEEAHGELEKQGLYVPLA